MAARHACRPVQCRRRWGGGEEWPGSHDGRCRVPELAMSTVAHLTRAKPGKGNADRGAARMELRGCRW
jgi:hypothetical protein